MPIVRFRPEVEFDLREAAEWYDSKRAGLGDEFQDEFWKAMEAVVARPRSFANTALGVRASRLARFPYVILSATITTRSSFIP